MSWLRLHCARAPARAPKGGKLCDRLAAKAEAGLILRLAAFSIRRRAIIILRVWSLSAAALATAAGAAAALAAAPVTAAAGASEPTALAALAALTALAAALAAATSQSRVEAWKPSFLSQNILIKAPR